MISLLLGILAGISAIVALVSFLVAFLPDLVNSFNLSYEHVLAVTNMLPDWVIPYVLVAITVAIISLGVKLL